MLSRFLGHTVTQSDIASYGRLIFLTDCCRARFMIIIRISSPGAKYNFWKPPVSPVNPKNIGVKKSWPQHYTVYPRSLDTICKVTYYLKRDKTP